MTAPRSPDDDIHPAAPGLVLATAVSLPIWVAVGLAIWWAW